MMFTLDGKEVQLKELNFGDVLDLQEKIDGLSDTAQALQMVSFMTDVSIEEIRAMHPRVMREVTKIALEVASIFESLES